MQKQTRCLVVVITLLLLVQTSCKKGFLDAPPDPSISTPTSMKDCQALLDNDIVMNGYGGRGYPALGSVGSDDYYVSASQYAQYTATDQHAVTWSYPVYTEEEVNDWDLPYRTILYANVVLEALDKLYPEASDQHIWNNLRGSALFFRAYAYYQLAQIFVNTYDSADAASGYGLPLRRSTDVNERFRRSTVKETYDQIIGDLTAAIRILPDSAKKGPSGPSRPAAYALLSRTWLVAGDYSAALLFADSCLQMRSALLDYNKVDTSGLLPFTRNNTEVIFAAASSSTGPLITGKSFVDSLLLPSYAANDRRRTLFFRNGRFFLGWYDEDGYAFSGIATDEIWLIRAECLARKGDVSAALASLDSLLLRRFADGTFTPSTAVDARDALRQVLTERRKELLYRGLRWTDLRRLNKDPATAIAIHRTVNGQTYTLSPDSRAYTWPIPEKVLVMNPDMQQNPHP